MSDLNLQLVLRFIDRATAPARAAMQAVERAGMGAQQIGQRQMALAKAQMAQAAGRNRALTGEALAIAGTGYAMAKALGPAIEFEKQMAEVGKVVDFQGATGIKLLGDDIQRLVTEGGITMAADQIAQIVAAAGQASLINEALPDAAKRAELVEFAKAASMMGVAFDISASDAGAAMASWRTKLKLNQEEALMLGDAVNYLSNKMNASAAAVTEVIARQGALAQVAGLSTSEIAALSAAFVSASPSPEIAATAMKNFTSTLVSGEAMTKSQSAVMARLGFDATDLAQRMGVDAKGAIVDVMQELAKLPQYEQSAALSQLFGEESVGAIAPLLSNLGNLTRAFALVSDEQVFAGAMTKEYAAVASVTAANIERMRNWTSRFATVIGAALLPALNDLMATMFPIVLKMIEWAEAHPIQIAAIAKLAVGFLAFRAALVGVKFVVNTLTMAFWALRGGFGAVMWLIGGGLKAMSFFARGGAMLGRVLASVLVPALGMLRGALRLVGQALLWMGRAAMANPVLLVIGLIAGAVYAIYDNWDGIVEWFWAKIDRIAAAFDGGLLNGVLRILAEFNPFTLMAEAAMGLFTYITGWTFSDVTQALTSAFDIDLVGAGIAMIESLGAGIWSVLEGMVAKIKAKLTSIAPDWLVDGWSKVSGGADEKANTAQAMSNGPQLPGRALGGPVRAGQAYRWMEEGREFFVPQTEGSVLSTRALRAMGGAGSGSVQVGEIHIHAREGQDPLQIARAVKRELRAMMKPAGFGLHDGESYV